MVQYLEKYGSVVQQLASRDCNWVNRQISAISPLLYTCSGHPGLETKILYSIVLYCKVHKSIALAEDARV